MPGALLGGTIGVGVLCGELGWKWGQGHIEGHGVKLMPGEY